MPSVFVDDGEAALLREVLEHAYRVQHREQWEVSHFGDAAILPSVSRRLQSLGELLVKFGGRTDTVVE